MSERDDMLAEILSLRGDVREARGEVERLRRLLAAGAAKVLDLEAERDDLRDTDDVLRVDLALRDAEVAGLNLELERLRIVETASVGAHALLADAEADREVLREGYHAAMEQAGKLRALLSRALDGWAELDQWIADDRSGGLAHDVEIAEIRREAGLG